MKSKRSKLKKLEQLPVINDLFGIGVAEHHRKIENVREEVSALERGEFNYYVPPTYINEIKKWINDER